MTFTYFSPRPLLAALTVVLVVGAGGCAPADDGTAQSTAPTLPTVPFAPTSTTTSVAPAATDYRRLLLTAADLTDAEDTFVERSREEDPNGGTGASAFFVNDKDNRAIVDTFLIYPDAATATATLKQAAGTLPTLVAGGAPRPLAVGADGVMVAGTSPDGDKAVTLAFFSEGTALIRLEFQSATGDATTDQFVVNVAKMQQIALRIGLADHG
jgi:hypothetical protein